MLPNDHPTIAKLLVDTRLPELGPGRRNEVMRPLLATLTPESLFPQLRDRDMAIACISGLWLLHDFLDESHTLSQDIDTPTGSFWHAIMHRREPDPSNSKYWWRRVGAHPVLAQLVEHSPSLGYEYTDPFAFVDFVEKVRDSKSADESLAKVIQRLEWNLQFAWCWAKAMGNSQE